MTYQQTLTQTLPSEQIMNNLIKINNVEHLTAMVKAIVPRSFEKTFGGLSTDEVVAGFTFCVAGLSQTELNAGLNKIREMGFCPDPAMFAKWCKGIDGFDNTDAIADSYIGKHGALAQIIKWQQDPKTPITVAQKEAYDDTYHLWTSINSSSDALRAELAYKDVYEQIVAAAIANKIECQTYVPQAALQAPSDTTNQTMIADSDFVKQNLAKLKQMMAANLRTVA